MDKLERYYRFLLIINEHPFVTEHDLCDFFNMEEKEVENIINELKAKSLLNTTMHGVSFKGVKYISHYGELRKLL